MRRILLLLILIHFNFLCSFSQNRVRDSILVQLNAHQQQDTTRVVLLMRLADSYVGNNPDTSIIVADDGISLSKKLRYTRRLASLYAIQGFNFSAKGQFEKGVELQKKALEAANQINVPTLKVKILNVIAGDYTHLSNYNEALKYLNEASDIAQKTNNKSGLASILGNMANIYTLLQDYDKGLEYAFQSLHLHEELNEANQVALMHNNISAMYIKKKDYRQAIAQNLMALKIYDSTKLRKGIASSYLGLGISYNRTKEYSSAIHYLKKSLAIYDSLGAIDNAAASLADLAIVYSEAPDSILLNNNVSPSDRFKVAGHYASMGLAFSKDTKNLDGLSDQLKVLSEIYENNKNYDSALYAYKQYATLHDSIAGDEKRKEITRKEVQYEDDKKLAIVKAKSESDKKLAILKMESEADKKQAIVKAESEADKKQAILKLENESDKKQAVLKAESEAQVKRQRIIKNIIIYGAAILLLAGIGLFIFYKRRKDAVSKQKEAELKSEISDTEMKALRAQMNPHFIFNSLNSISDYIAKNKTELADEYLTKFAKLMRLVLENSEKKEVTLSEDLKALELYMQLESLRLNNKFTYRIKVDDDIDKETAMIPPLILQPFVENSIWHGIAKKEGIGHITIFIKKEGEMINCMVEDDGVGRKNMDELTSLKDSIRKRSLGMKITKERIDIINKTKQVTASMKLTDLMPGTRVELKLPFESTF